MIDAIRRLNIFSPGLFLLALAAVLPPLFVYVFQPANFALKAAVDLIWLVGVTGFHMVLFQRLSGLPRKRDRWIVAGALFAAMVAARIWAGALGLAVLPTLVLGLVAALIGAALIFGASLIALWVLLVVFTSEQDFVSDGIGRFVDALD